MTYTILSARYANAEGTSAVIVTAEAGAVLASIADTPALWADMLASTVPAPYVDLMWRPLIWSQFKETRDVWLARLEGVAGRAFRSGNTDFAADIDVFIQGILDIPQHATTQDAVTPTKAHLEYAINKRLVDLKNECLGDPDPVLNPQYATRKAAIDKVFK